MTDRVREALFSIIGSEVEGARVLDLFGGSASLSCEALSRGAEWATVVDRASQAVETARANLNLCGFASRSEVVCSDVARFVRRLGSDRTYNLIFVDPPYADDDQTVRDLLAAGVAGWEGKALVVLHRDTRSKGEDHRFGWPSGYRLEGERIYGGTTLCFARYVGGGHDLGETPDDPGRR